MKRYYQNNVQLRSKNKPRFNGVYSRNHSSKIKDETYVINLYEYKYVGTHLIALYITGTNAIFFDSLGVEYIPKKIKNNK